MQAGKEGLLQAHHSSHPTANRGEYLCFCVCVCVCDARVY